MRLSLKSAPKWLAIPPVVAVLIMLGPLSMGGNEDQPATNPPTTSQPAAAQPAAKPASKGRAVPGSLVPRTPDLWKMGSALIGVLLLGVGGILVLRRMRGGAVPNGKVSLVSLRQTMRLTSKQALHAVEFDNRILLLGENEKGLSLIDSGRLPDVADDEASVLARHLPQPEDDGGAVPKNLLIPRPDHAPQRTPTPPAVAPSKADHAIAKLNDFRNLLQKAGR